MSYKDGSKVRIKNNLNRGNYYGDLRVTNMHLKYSNQETTIIEYNNGYRLELDNGETRWAYDMLELVDEGKSKEAIDKSELIFEKLKYSPIEYILLDDTHEERLIQALQNNYNIICDGKNSIKYDDIPKLIKWLQNVYTYCTELKNKVEYVDWKTARNHMEQGAKCSFKNEVHFISDRELRWINNDEQEITSITLEMLDSKEWILL